MMTASLMPKEVAAAYADECRFARGEGGGTLAQGQLTLMAANLDRVPWEPSVTFHEAVQSPLAHPHAGDEHENYPARRVVRAA
jgi:pyruvate-formate lyase